MQSKLGLTVLTCAISLGCSSSNGGANTGEPPAVTGNLAVPDGGAAGTQDGDVPACRAFAVGGIVGAEIGGSVASRIGAQGIADFAGAAASSIDAVARSCTAIARGLGVSSADEGAAEATPDKTARMKAWCSLAAGAIDRATATSGGTSRVVTTRPTCQTSVRAKVACRKKCSDTLCNLTATPPVCTGGSLTLSCNGLCTPESPLGDLTCKGTCNGTCHEPCTGGSCNGGTCDGKCSGTCVGTETVPVLCDGRCHEAFEPLACVGGKLEGGCLADAKCDAGCDLTLVAKAECAPRDVRVAMTGNSSGRADELEATLASNLSALLATRARLVSMADANGGLIRVVASSSDITPACVPTVANAAATAVADVTAALTSANVVAKGAGD